MPVSSNGTNGHHQQQQQQLQVLPSSVQLQLQPMAGTGTTFRWREKEAEMQTLQQRLTEREREIGRLKEKLRDLTKKLQQQQQLYNSKVFSRLSMTMTTRFRPVAHSVARRRVPVTQSDYKQKKKKKVYQNRS